MQLITAGMMNLVRTAVYLHLYMQQHASLITRHKNAKEII